MRYLKSRFAHLSLLQVRRWAIILLVSSVLIGTAAIHGRESVRVLSLASTDRYYIRVAGCDDGGRAYVNKTQVVDVGFNEDSTWLDITEDLTRDNNKVRFEVINKTGAVTYVFQVRRNQTLVFNETCGMAAIVGCENNRAFRLGVAREFTYVIDKDR